jgi:hypothetical protein
MDMVDSLDAMESMDRHRQRRSGVRPGEFHALGLRVNGEIEGWGDFLACFD